MPDSRWLFALLLLVLAVASGAAFAQSTADAEALAAKASGLNDKELRKLPAKKVFGGQKGPTTSLKARAIGSYAMGCMAGGKALEVDGPAWQVMRLSRNRNWGHPELISLVERLAAEAKNKDGWNGLLVGDLAQPRGGPMLSGHASHQIGLDVDIWLTPMPERTLTRKEREEIKGKLVVKDRKRIDPDVWTEAHARLLKRAASYPEVARIFVHPPIKAEMCKWAKGKGEWLAKIRPYFGHNWHFHIRIKCPAGSPNCKNQPEARPKDGTGCGDELAYWLGEKPWPKPPKQEAAPKKPAKPAPPLTLSALPAECRAIVTAE
jgi:penicillin-insensitive murein endopeptidase